MIGRRWRALGFGLLGLVLAAPAAQAMKFTRRDELLIVQGMAAAGDAERLREALTPEVTVVVLRAPGGGGLASGRELAALIEAARVTTVVHGACAGFACPMMFLAGQERLFSAGMRPEASYVRLAIASGFLPDTAGVDSGESWEAQMAWWRAHTRLSAAQTTPQAEPLAPGATRPAESTMFFHPAARAGQGSVLHCRGERQSVPYCEAQRGEDALQLGVITRPERFEHSELREKADLPRPPATGLAPLDEVPARLSEACAKVYGEFLRYERPRAFAISTGKACAARSAQSPRPYAEALAACQKISSGRECRLYAVDDDVVFSEFSLAAEGAPR